MVTLLIFQVQKFWSNLKAMKSSQKEWGWGNDMIYSSFREHSGNYVSNGGGRVTEDNLEAGRMWKWSQYKCINRTFSYRVWIAIKVSIYHPLVSHLLHGRWGSKCLSVLSHLNLVTPFQDGCYYYVSFYVRIPRQREGKLFAEDSRRIQIQAHGLNRPPDPMFVTSNFHCNYIGLNQWWLMSGSQPVFA